MTRHLTASAIAWLVASVLSSQPAVAQDAPPRVTLAEDPPCAPPWWDRASFARILDVELRQSHAELVEDASTSVAIRIDCDDDARAEVVVLSPATGPVVRPLRLGDVALERRVRTLALAATDLVAEIASRVHTRRDPDPTIRDCGTRSEPPRERRSSDRAALLSSPIATATPSARRDVEATLSARGRAALLGALGTPSGAGGGDLELELIFTGSPIGLLVGASGEYTRSESALGAIDGGWAGGYVGGRGVIEAGPVRIGLSLSLALGYVRLEGHARRAGVIAAGADTFFAALDAALSCAIPLGDRVRVSLLAGVRGWAAALEAVVSGSTLLSLSGAEPFVELGLGVML